MQTALFQDNPAYDTSKICGEVWSVCDPKGLSPAVKPGSIDVATLIVRDTPATKSDYVNHMLTARRNVTFISSVSQLCIPVNGRML